MLIQWTLVILTLCVIWGVRNWLLKLVTRISAEKGCSSAQYDLAMNYSASKQYEQAIYWLSKSAEQENALSQRILGAMYDLGIGILQDCEKAAYWWQKSAEQGDGGSQALLAQAYEKGKGVPQDYQKAYIWFSIASQKNVPATAERRDYIANLLTPDQLEKAKQLFQDSKHTIEAVRGGG
jgi:TPR repeat protein